MPVTHLTLAVVAWCVPAVDDFVSPSSTVAVAVLLSVHRVQSQSKQSDSLKISTCPHNVHPCVEFTICTAPSNDN